MPQTTKSTTSKYIFIGVLVGVIIFIIWWYVHDRSSQEDLVNTEPGVEQSLPVDTTQPSPLPYELPEQTAVYEQDNQGRYIFHDVAVSPESQWDVVFSTERSLSLAQVGVSEGMIGNGIEITRYDQVEDMAAFVEDWSNTTNCPDCYMQPLFVTLNTYLIVDLASMGYIGHFFVSFDDGIVYKITVFDRDLKFADIMDKYITYIKED